MVDRRLQDRAQVAPSSVIALSVLQNYWGTLGFPLLEFGVLASFLPSNMSHDVRTNNMLISVLPSNTRFSYVHELERRARRILWIFHFYGAPENWWWNVQRNGKRPLRICPGNLCRSVPRQLWLALRHCVRRTKGPVGDLIQCTRCY
jgi:hypothetical protein